MCGIAGIVGKRPISSELLEAMLSCIAHRGPDDAGIWLNADASVGLVHSRLSILDLSDRGRQPMSSADSSLRLVFNGEIYNFREIRRELEELGCKFITETDTEVILHGYEQWGTDCVRRFNGMFAFAVHDGRKNLLVLARDRIGKKPLYYFEEGGCFAFASESKALELVAKPGIDLRSLNFYLAYGYLPAERSIFKNFQKLLPAHTLTYDIGSRVSHTAPYWKFPPAAESPVVQADPTTLIDVLQALLVDSVRLRLEADVPIGVLLSGGIDSSLIAAAAASVASRPIKTFTVTFPGGGHFDESGHARIVASALGTEHHELPMEGQDWATLETICRHLDEPLGDPSILPTYALSKLVRKHVTVALGGDGGDELFGGYAWYEKALRVNRLLKATPRIARNSLARWADDLPAGFRGRTLLRASGSDFRGFRLESSLSFDAPLRSRLFKREIWEELGENQLEPELFGQRAWQKGGDPITEMSLWDLQVYLPEDILTKVDRASMAVALEVRAPWLDYRMIEFAVGRVPSELKVHAGKSRILQRLLGQRMLPSELNLNRKQGFVMPTHAWLKGAWAEPARDVLHSPAMAEYFDVKFITRMSDDLRKGYTNSVRLFALVVLGLWLENGSRHPANVINSGCSAAW